MRSRVSKYGLSRFHSHLRHVHWTCVTAACCSNMPDLTGSSGKDLPAAAQHPFARCRSCGLASVPSKTAMQETV